MRTLLLFGGILGVLAIAGFVIFSFSKPQIEPEILAIPTPPSGAEPLRGGAKTVGTKASFAIFTNGTFRIFTDSMYHNLSADVFIEASNPNVVHVKKAGITWDDFFKTLPMKLTHDCLTTGTGQNFCTNSNQTLKFYINGKLDSNALDQTINARDQLLVSYGNENDTEIEKQRQQIPTVK